jgi:hypothetical protein
MSAESNLVPAPDDAEMEIGWVLLAPIRIPSYQREAFENRIKRLSPFDTRACGTLELSYRDRVLWVVDGQARRAKAMRDGLDRLPGRVNYYLTEPEEAEMYLRLNRDRLAVSALDRHKAESIALDPRAIALDDVLHRNGLVAATASSNGLEPFRSISKAESVYDDGGAELVERVLKLLIDGLPGDTHRFRGTLVGGLGFFLARDSWGADDKKVLAALRRSTGTQLDEKMRHAQALSGKVTTGSYVYMARAIAVAVYRERGATWKPTRTATTPAPTDPEQLDVDDDGGESA